MMKDTLLLKYVISALIRLYYIILHFSIWDNNTMGLPQKKKKKKLWVAMFDMTH